ncbi:hypothetical protein [Thalassospira xiamenensis]|uniref:Uncharacterized protein n=1 Tax=Thalassospira xiamenensis TaxID=220697 RepID=A0A367X4C5_9PROT|nr:hypothetical protein [Thalassospira xiamenensis]KZB54379.1 hypothetical protein AUP41_01155 [Thalassospira xiamenensis]MCK2165662.1 hypothetical protein [Thalassospira xiamenensis]RCK48523.1 hypothetical protein TH44_15475 [Thalassospira xiamenensis]
MARKPAGSKKKGAFSGLSVVASAVLLFMVALPTFITLAVGLLPSMIAFLFDRSQGRTMSRCIFGLNFSGVAPYILEVWQYSSQSASVATQHIFQPVALSIMYGSAGLGWLLYLAMPPIVANVLNLSAQRRVSELRKKQRGLIKTWGDSLIKEIDRSGS